MKKLFSICLFTCLASLFAVCKAQTADDCTYLQVITYLHTDSTAQETIRQSFGFTSRKVRKRIPHMGFSVHERIKFLDLSGFRNLPPDVLQDEKAYHEKYNFEPYTNFFLQKIAIKGYLYLTFSKPINKHLVVEISNINPDEGLHIKFGLGLIIFFHFNQDGVIDYVAYSRVIYN